MSTGHGGTTPLLYEASPQQPDKPRLRLGVSHTMLSMDSMDEEPFVGHHTPSSLSNLSASDSVPTSASTSPKFGQRRESLAQQTAVRNSQPQFQPSLPSARATLLSADTPLNTRRLSVHSHVSALADAQPADDPYCFLNTPNRDRVRAG